MASAAKNKAVVLEKADIESPCSGVVVEDLPMPVPQAGEVLVHLSMRPINPADVFSLKGVYPGFQPTGNGKAVVGLEGMGTVVAVGDGVTKVSSGTRVVGIPFNTVETGVGTWQEYIVAKEDSVFPVPDGVSDEDASQFWVGVVTVYAMLEELSIPKGEYLLQTAAGSVLGRQMIQLAKHYGIKTINVVRRESLVEELKAEGADEVIVSTGETAEEKQELQRRVMEITGQKGAWAAIECVGGELFSAVTSAVRPNGVSMIYGAMSGLSASYSIIDPLFRGITIKGFWLVPWFKSQTADELHKNCGEAMRLLEQGIIKVYNGEKFTLDDVVKAVETAEKNARGGRVLLTN